MINKAFHFMLRKLKDGNGEPWTVGKIADAIYVSRARLNDALNNHTGHGHQTRPKVVKFFDRQFPQEKAALLEALKWDNAGNILPAEKPHGTIRSTWNLT